MRGDARRAVETGNTGPVIATRVRGIAHSRRRVKGQSKPTGRQTVGTACSIAWPAIDVTWRFSLLLFGALVAHAPQFSAQLGGLQNSDVTPYS